MTPNPVVSLIKARQYQSSARHEAAQAAHYLDLSLREPDFSTYKRCWERSARLSAEYARKARRHMELE